MRKRWVALVAAVAALAGLTGGVASAAESPVGAAQVGSPFDDPNVFCRRHAAPAGARNTSQPGVGRDTLTISDASIDTKNLRRLGIDQMDFSQAIAVFWEEVNKCGGINGRRVNLKRAQYNPAAVDQAGHLQATCLKITEDQKALVAVAVGGGRIERCVTVQHKTIYTARDGAPADDFAASKGRLISLYPAGDSLAAGFIADGHAQGTFRRRTIGVVGAALNPTAPTEQRDQYVKDLEQRGYEVTSFEVLPCQGNVCTQGTGAAIRRMKEKGVDLVVLSHLIGVTSAAQIFRELKGQNLRATVVGPDVGALHGDSNLATFLRSAGSDGAEFAAKNGWYSTGMAEVRNGWRTGSTKESPFARMCTATLAKATGERQYRYVEQDLADGRWSGTVNVCVMVRSIARAIWSLGPNVTTERLVNALRTQPPVDAGDSSKRFSDRQWYLGSALRSPSATTMEFHFPCPLPRRTQTACMLPLDRPARVRAIRY